MVRRNALARHNPHKRLTILVHPRYAFPKTHPPHPQLTNPGFPTSIYPYRALFSPSRRPFDYIKKPTGYSFFPYELYPGLKSNVAKNVNLVHYAQHERGGHFAALERPADLWGDVQGFVKEAWKEGDAKL
jgi:hypothetical protein